MKIFAAAVLASALSIGLLAAPAQANDLPIPSGAYEMDANHASLVWSVSHIGLSDYTAKFIKFDIDLNLDVEDPTKSTVSAVIDPLSVVTNYPGDTDFDAKISTSDRFFNSGAFPEVTFQSTRVEPTGDTTAKIYGDLTILGVTQEVVLDSQLNGAFETHPFLKKPGVGFTATTTIDRTAFGMDYLVSAVPNTDVPIVGATVDVVIQAEFSLAE
ncbi:MAG: YceI family protein [Pseudomonadota bacterium]